MERLRLLLLLLLLAVVVVIGSDDAAATTNLVAGDPSVLATQMMLFCRRHEDEMPCCELPVVDLVPCLCSLLAAHGGHLAAGCRQLQVTTTSLLPSFMAVSPAIPNLPPRVELQHISPGPAGREHQNTGEFQQQINDNEQSIPALKTAMFSPAGSQHHSRRQPTGGPNRCSAAFLAHGLTQSCDVDKAVPSRDCCAVVLMTIYATNSVFVRWLTNSSLRIRCSLPSLCGTPTEPVTGSDRLSPRIPPVVNRRMKKKEKEEEKEKEKDPGKLSDWAITGIVLGSSAFLSAIATGAVVTYKKISKKMPQQIVIAPSLANEVPVQSPTPEFAISLPEQQEAPASDDNRLEPPPSKPPLAKDGSELELVPPCARPPPTGPPPPLPRPIMPPPRPIMPLPPPLLPVVAY